MRDVHTIIFILLLFSVLSCAPKPLIKVDIDTYLKNQSQYKGKNVVITATLKGVIKNYDLYRGKEIEVSAPVTYYGKNLFWTWYVMLEKEGMKLRCYEFKDRLVPDPLAVDAAIKARINGDDMTVIGRLNSDGIELDRIIYDGYDIDTNHPIYTRPILPVF